MKCPKCGSEQSRVSNTRNRLDGAIRRQRKCIVCGKNWFTIETHEDDFVYITIGDAKRILRML